MKRKETVSNSITMIYIILLLIYTLISNILIKYDIYAMLNFSKVLIFFAGVGILIYIINKILNGFKVDLFDVLIYSLILFGIISTCNAIDLEISLYGFDGRYEGFFQLLLYYVLFLNGKELNNKKFKKLIIGLIIVVGIIQSFYGVLQFFDVKNFLELEILRIRYYSTGFEINPNFFGTLTLIGLSLSLLIYFFHDKTRVSVLTLCSSIILFLGLLCSGAMSCAVAFILLSIGIIIILLFTFKLDKKRFFAKILIIIVSFLISYKFFNEYDGGYYLSQIGQSTFEMGETLTGNANPIYGSGRIHIWTETLKIVPDNIWNGVGIDNLYYAFDEEEHLIDLKSGLWVDKAHNEYLQKLITEGIFSIIAYLILLAVLFIKSIKKIVVNLHNVDYLLVALFMCFCAYCIQAFFNISVISVAPIFYIVMGLLCSLVGDDKNGKVKC